MAVWVALLALAIPTVALVTQRLLVPRDVPARQRVAHTAVTALAIPAAWGATLMLSEALLGRAGPVGLTGYAVAMLAPPLLLGTLVALARRVPWTSAWPLALSALVVSAALLIGVRSPERTFVALVALAGAAAVASPAVAGALARITVPRVAFAVATGLLLLLPAVYGATTAVVSLTEGTLASEATQAWSVSFEPDAAGAYVLIVPFFEVDEHRAPEPHARVTLDTLRDSIRLAAGQAAVAFVDDGRAIEVRGEGPIRIEARIAFYGPGNEGFLRYRLPDTPVSLDAQAPPGQFVVEVDFSGGTGHTCWATGSTSLMLAPGESAMLPGRDPFREDGRVAAACA